jgi:ABC-2 type transport system permease protein
MSVATSSLISVSTLYWREVWRFLKVYNQTILAPVATNLLFLAVFTLALGGSERMVAGMPFHQFIIPGLTMMAITQNAFANTASSLMLSKVQGVIIDLLMPPFTPGNLTFALAMGGVTRGLCVGIAVVVAMVPFVPFTILHPGLALFYTLSASLMLALMGILTGIWSQSFDQMSAITNYVITPLAFLSGTFYSVHQLPPFWQAVSHADPFFYMIDGMRYSFTGHADAPIMTGILVMVGINAGLWILTHWILAKGYRLKQ